MERTRKRFSRLLSLAAVPALLLAQLAVGGALGTAAVEVPLTYNAYDDYQTETQPENWRYQDGAPDGSGGFTYTDLAWNGTQWHSGRAYVATNRDGYMTGEDTIWFHPGAGVASVVTFIAPYTGTVQISSASGHGIAVADESADGIVFSIRNGNTELFEPTVVTKDNRVNPNQNNIKFDLTTQVTKGDQIHFIVEMNGNNAGDSTFVTPTVTYTEIAPEADTTVPVFGQGGVTYNDVSESGFTVSWPAATDNSGAVAEYVVYLSDTAITAVPAEGGISAGTATSLAVTGKTASTAYYVAVAAKDASGNTALLSAAAAVTTKPANTYNAYQGYYQEAQPENSPWRYFSSSVDGDTGARSFEAIPWNANEGYWGNGDHGTIRTASGDRVTTLTLHLLQIDPGVQRDTVVAFVAPYTGTVQLSSENGGVFVPLNGADQNYDGIDFTIMHNGDVLYSKESVSTLNNTEGNRCFSEAITANVTAGDTLYFIVGRHTNTANDSTFFNPEVTYTSITPPVTEDTEAPAFAQDAAITVSGVTGSGFTLSWPAASDNTAVTEYVVYVADAAITEIPAEGGLSAGTATTYTLSGLQVSAAYYVAVAAKDAAGNAVLLSRAEPVETTSMPAYNAYEQYTGENQPISTPWRYQNGFNNGTAYVYEDLFWSAADGRWGSGAAGIIDTVENDQVTGLPAMMLHPGSERDAVLTFIAPYTGTIEVRLANGGVFVPLNGEMQGYDGINFTLLHGTEELFAQEGVSAKHLNPEEVRCFTQTLTVEVEAGDELHFIVNANTATANDTTYLNPEVTYVEMDAPEEELSFAPGAAIEVSGIGENGFTLRWPAAISSTGSTVTYTLYLADEPVTAIPAEGGIELGDKLTYTAENLSMGHTYYAAVAARSADGKTALLARAEGISTLAPTYNAYEDYTEETQPESVWSYASRYLNGSAYAYELLTWNAEESYWGSVETGIVGTVDSDLVTGAPALMMHPAPGREAAVIFTAPYTGEVEVSMANGGVFAPLNGALQNYDGINFLLLHGTEELFAQEGVSANNLNPEDVRCFSGTVKVKVTAGDRLYFLVGANETTDNDVTYLNPRIRYLSVETDNVDTGYTGIAVTMAVLLALAAAAAVIVMANGRKERLAGRKGA